MNADTQQDDAAEAESPEVIEAEVEAAEDAEAPTEGEKPFEPKVVEKTPEAAEETIARLETERLRIAADFANYQKRVNRDRTRWTQDAVRDAVASLLPVLDNLEHAIKACEGDVTDTAGIKKGVELVQSELLRVLGIYQLEQINPEEGTPFDPDQHQAISLVPGDVEEEMVAMTARTGYKLGETVLRAAQVVVKKPS